MKSLIILTTLLSVLSVFSLASAQSQYNSAFVFSADIHSNDTLTLREFKVLTGTPNIYPGDSGNYTMKILSFDDKILSEASFDIGFVSYEEGLDEQGNMYGKEIIIPTVYKYLRLPYFRDAKTIELYHRNKLIFSLNTADYLCKKNSVCDKYENDLNCPLDCTKKPTSAVCGNNNCEKNEDCIGCPKDCGACKKAVNCGNKICDAGENYKTCKKDCPSGSEDKYCDSIEDGKCDPDCTGTKDPDCNSKESNLGYYIIAVILVLMALIFFYGRRKIISSV